MPKYEVEMVAFGDRGIREVEVPDHDLAGALSEKELLERIFRWGQNDFQPSGKFPSVSVGDVVRLNGKRFAVVAVGFKELAPGEEGGLNHFIPGLGDLAKDAFKKKGL